MNKKIIKDKPEKTQGSGRTLVNVDLYLKNGIHIGTKYKNGPMRKFIFKSRSDKINVMDVQGIDKRIKTSIEFISRYEPQDVVFISRKKYALPGIKILEQVFGYKSKLNRFIPGTFTNPESEHFLEPKLVFIADPNVDRQAVVESTKANIPIIALCTTSSNTRNIDFIIPYNNKGRKSVALYFWILIRELELKNGIIKSDKDYAYNIDDLVYNSEAGEKEIDDEQSGQKKRGRQSSRTPIRRQAPVRRPGSSPIKRPYIKKPEASATVPEENKTKDTENPVAKNPITETKEKKPVAEKPITETKEKKPKAEKPITETKEKKPKAERESKK